MKKKMKKTQQAIVTFFSDRDRRLERPDEDEKLNSRERYDRIVESISAEIDRVLGRKGPPNGI